MDIVINWQLKYILKIVSFPVIVTFSSIIPVLNSVLFSHAALGWFLVALSFPWVLGVIIIDIKRNLHAEIKNHIIYGVAFLIFYMILTYPLAFIFQKGLMIVGNSMELKEAWEFYVVPFSLLFR